jgi:hypothetical protein
VAENLAQEERFGGVRDAVACRCRWQRDRSRFDRELSDAIVPAQRARDRAADYGGLSPVRPDRQIEVISRATPKRDYYCQSRRGNRLFELGLGAAALAFTAASSKSDQAAIANLFAVHGASGFAAAWLTHKEVAWAAELLPTLAPETSR